jgi:hypothetical protein
MGNSTVSHCRLPVLGNINGQFFQNHRWLITPDPGSEPPPGLQIGRLRERFRPRHPDPHVAPKNVPLRATLEPGHPATLSEFQIGRILAYPLQVISTQLRRRGVIQAAMDKAASGDGQR